MPQLLWVIYGFLWGAGWVFAFMAYLQARNFVRHVSALVRLNLDRQLKNRRDRPILRGYVPINFMDRGINPSADLTNLAEGGGWNSQAHDQIDDRDINFVDREP